MSIENTTKIVIVSAARTPMGGMLGCFSDVHVTELGAVAIKAAIDKAGIDPTQVDECIMGNVLSAGVGQAPARQAALKAGLPESTSCTTVNKVCGSGLKTLMIAADQLKAGSVNMVVAGGMESMTNAPYFIEKARKGMRLGHSEIKDHMFFDGLEDANTSKAMGVLAEQTIAEEGLTRESLDNFAIESLRRANAAIANGHFKEEVAPVIVKNRKGDVSIDTDEQPAKAKPEKIPQLRPAFSKDGKLTPANSSSISDGAAALVVTTEAKAAALGLKPMARLVAQATHAQAPKDFCTAPVSAIAKVLDGAGWNSSEVDLYEINEAFASVTLLGASKHGVDMSKVNISGGACALGHPLGASGARILVTLLHGLQRTGQRKGVASLCIGGGEGVAVAVEML